MIWFNEVESVIVTEDNIEKATKWLNAKLKYVSDDKMNLKPFIELKTARGYLMINLGDEIQKNSANYVFVVRKGSELSLDGTMPKPKNHRARIERDHSGHDRVRNGGQK